MSQVITLDDLETYMAGKSVDPGLGQQIVDGLNDWVDTHTGRCFGDTKIVTEVYDWSNSIWLRHMDALTVNSITLGWPGQTTSIVDSKAYFFNPLGRITFFAWWSLGGASRPYRDYVSINYTYGVIDVPDDLKAAALGVAAGMYNWAINGNRDVAAVSVGSYQIQYTNKRQSSGASVPDPATSSADANWGVIESYKLRRQ